MVVLGGAGVVFHERGAPVNPESQTLGGRNLNVSAVRRRNIHDGVGLAEILPSRAYYGAHLACRVQG